MSVTINLPLQTLTMELEIYGEESRNAVILNGNQVAFIPPQGETPPAPTEIDPVDLTLLNSPDLRSSRMYYPLDVLYFIRPLRPYVLSHFPRDSHAWMNLDSPEQGFKFDYAMQAAIKRTKIEFDKTTLGFSEEMCRLFLDR